MKSDRTTLQVRITHPERLRFERRAQSVDLSISEWARLVLRRDCDLWTGETKMTKHTDSSDYETITTAEHEAIEARAQLRSAHAHEAGVTRLGHNDRNAMPVADAQARLAKAEAALPAGEASEPEMLTAEQVNEECHDRRVDVSAVWEDLAGGDVIPVVERTKFESAVRRVIRER